MAPIWDPGVASRGLIGYATAPAPPKVEYLSSFAASHVHELEGGSDMQSSHDSPDLSQKARTRVARTQTQVIWHGMWMSQEAAQPAVQRESLSYLLIPFFSSLLQGPSYNEGREHLI